MSGDVAIAPFLHAPEELPFLAEEIGRSRSYLEFGCGGSTLLAAADPGRRVVTVDSDARWIEKVRAALPDSSAGNVTFVHADWGPVRQWGWPVDQQAVTNWPRYFVDPWRALLSTGERPDLIYVDGRLRVACTLYSLLMLGQRWLGNARATRILIHDFDRREYGTILDHARVLKRVNRLCVLRPRTRPEIARLVNDLLVAQFDLR